MLNLNRIRDKKFHHFVLALIILLVLSLAYAFGKFYYQRSSQVERILMVINQPKANLAPYVTAQDPDLAVTTASLKPLQSYFQKNPQAYRTLAKNLRQNRTSSQIKLSQTGSYYFLFPKYTLRLAVYRPQAQTNHPNSQLSMNQTKLGTMQGANQNYYADLGMLFPGRYHLTVKTKVDKRALSTDSIVNIWSDKTINMDIKTASFQIRSVPNGIVYLNDKKLVKLDDNGRASFSNYPLAKNLELYVVSSYGGKKIKSEVVKDLASSINSEFADSDDSAEDYAASDFEGNQAQDVYQDVEGDYVVNPLWKGLIDRHTAGRLLYQAYLKANKRNFKDPKKNKDYLALKRQLAKFKRNKQNLKLSVNISQILPAGDNYSSVTYQLVYKFKQNNKKHTKTFTFTNALFHQEEDSQLIENLGKKIK